MNQQVQVFRTISDCPSDSVQRCLELIARCAPRFLRAAGGLSGRGPDERAVRAARALGAAQRAAQARERARVPARVVELRRQGRTYREIGEEMGFSGTQARRYAMALGLPSRKRAANLGAEVVEQIRTLRLEGVMPGEIAARLGLPAGQVTERLRAMGLVRRYQKRASLEAGAEGERGVAAGR